jgi:hypothetical protein
MDNQRKILEMLAEKKITVDEAERLMSLVKAGGSIPPGDIGQPKLSPKYLRVEVRPKEGAANADHENVKIRVPLSLIRTGMKLTSIMPPEAYNRMNSALKEKGIEFDLRNIKPEQIEELIGALNDLEVDVQNSNQIIHIYAE